MSDRFWAKVVKSAGCWEWTGAVSGGGYGTFKVSGASVYAHRFAYELAHGPVPAGQQVMHSCDNRRCVNPAHLSAGTNADNQQDKQRKGRAAKKLTADQVVTLRARAAAGETQAALAAEFGVCQQAVCYAVNHGWSHLSA